MALTKTGSKVGSKKAAAKANLPAAARPLTLHGLIGAPGGKAGPAPRCSQCGRELPGVPFALHNLMCRECYGLDRYRAASESRAPEKPLETTISDENARRDS